MSTRTLIHWTENDAPHSASWRSAAGLPPPPRVMVADDRMSADAAYRLASEGTALLWRGDFQNARQLLQAMARRIDRTPRRVAKEAKLAPAVTAGQGRKGTKGIKEDPGAQAGAIAGTATRIDQFNRHRQAQSQRARTLGMLLIPMLADGIIPLRRAPDVLLACSEAYGAFGGNGNLAAKAGIEHEKAAHGIASVLSLRELQGVIGAHEWRKKGVEVPALAARIHPHYGVFAPIRSEYLDLVANTPLPATDRAFDIGTGTGVLAAILVQRGVRQVIATDLDARALECARDNLQRLGLAQQVEVRSADLFPEGRAGLIVCNPPWLPARPSSPLEHAVFDPESRMLRGFLTGLPSHLAAGGEGWLILSDLAEHLGLRSRTSLLELIAGAGLRVLGRTDIRPRHPRASDASDPLHAARAAEITSLWRLAALA